MQRHSTFSSAVVSGSRLLLLAVLLAAAGCAAGKKTATVSGKVTYKGQPVPQGAIHFDSPGLGTAMGTLRDDGSFTVTDVPLGEVKVTVQARDPGTYLRGAKERRPAFVAIPVKYSDTNTTDLVFTIAADVSDLEVKLE